jgi:sugar-specific transcriptional regulator TrmB
MLQELIEYGLSNREANVYIVCLKTGKATANRISELADLARSTTYEVLERLKTMGLISTIVVDNKTQFIASNPETLLTSLKEKQQSIKDVLPELKEIYKKVGDRPYAEVFQGKIAIIKLLDEILETAKNLKVIGNMGNALESIGYHPDKFRIKRIENKIPVKQILEVSDKSKEIKNKKLSYTEVRLLKSVSKSKEATFIFEDYVCHIVLQHEISAIKIKSEEHARATEIMFDELWSKAE